MSLTLHIPVYLISFFAETLYVTLLIKSGRPNPRWTVSSDHPKYQQVQQLLDQAITDKSVKEPKDMSSRLGYRGFLVKIGRQGDAKLIVGPETVALQKLLLNTSPDTKEMQRTRASASNEIEKQ